MKILHYTLGFPPKRSGGLVKYAMDVMNEEIRQGHEISVLYPGGLSFLRKNMYIKQENGPLNKYELVNSLPLAIFGGIKSPKDFMISVPDKIFEDFLKKVRPDIIHVHTLMGLPKEFFEVANKMKIKIIYTTHDYFGLAPNPTFFVDGKTFDEKNSNYFWNKASKYAFSTNKLRVFQLSIYPIIRGILKNNKFIKKINKFKNNTSTDDERLIENKIDDSSIVNYDDIRSYYKSIFLLIDKIHFNSSIAKRVFEYNIPELIGKPSKIISITNSNIIKHEKEKSSVKSGKIKVAYIGPNKEFKGFNFFLKLSQIMDCKKYEFHTYGYAPQDNIESVVQHGRYSSEDLPDIYRYVDVLIVPSRWKETFGLIVLEAMSFQTAVYVSNNVGAKDLLDSNSIFETMETLKNKIENTDVFNKNYYVKTIDEHIKELILFYKN